ncbi:JM102 [macacine gammaherpesvirus 11]|uniref:JM102 n=2 Tax=macacine gammaherpesvirus 11 TaxID=2560570 RepID=G9JMB0_9GAMA|nr:JM102 [Macaca fuscata rhadinovirus]AAT00079.1 JM102 [Macaca fuscata rhadinovirus]AEW87627.1 JM102 [Macaca fuscata rhadinovirus]AEW87797.1 JM102 [Macaca fuscata rhadinovirus]
MGGIRRLNRQTQGDLCIISRWVVSRLRGPCKSSKIIHHIKHLNGLPGRQVLILLLIVSKHFHFPVLQVLYGNASIRKGNQQTLLALFVHAP